MTTTTNHQATTPPILDEVRCRRLVVVDDQGAERIFTTVADEWAELVVRHPGEAGPSANMSASITGGDAVGCVMVSANGWAGADMVAAAVPGGREGIVNVYGRGGPGDPNRLKLEPDHSRMIRFREAQGVDAFGGCDGRCDHLALARSDEDRTLRRGAHDEMVEMIASGDWCGVVDQLAATAGSRNPYEVNPLEFDVFVGHHRWADPVTVYRFAQAIQRLHDESVQVGLRAAAKGVRARAIHR